MDQKRPLMAADRAADRARVAAEAVASTSAHGVTPIIVFVERRGSASAATAVSAIVGKLEMQDGRTYRGSRPRPAGGIYRIRGLPS